MLNNPLDILAINESKINESVSDDEISVSGFHLIRKDRNRHGGGVLMYIRKTIPFSERNDLQTACSLEMLCVEISRPCSRPFLVTTWYRPPGSDARLFDDFENFLSRCDLENKELLLMGDLNCDVSKFPPDAHTRRLQFISCVYQLEQLINEPTRVTRTSATLIDLIFTNKKENIVKSGVIHLGISYHSLIFAVRNFFTPKSRQNARYVRNFKNFNATDFLNDLSQIPWENVAQYENPNSCWQLWKSFYLQILDRHAPFRCMRIRANSLPWITPNIKNLMKARDFHKKKAVKFNSQVHWAKYKDTRNKVNSELYKAKKRYFFDKFEDCAQTKDPKQSWHHINHLLGRNFKSNNIPQLKIGDTIISDNLMIAEAFNDFFVSIGPKLSAEIVHDARKAFDSINHNILLRKMKEQFGISNIELKLFESYLSDREQVSFVNGAMSAPKRIVCGVPQGSILGPLLFLLYINDLPDCLEKSTPCLYADDSQIFSSAKDCVELNANLNHDLNNVSQWLVNNKLQHHSTKTKLMYVGSNHNHAKIDNEFPVMINDQLIPRVHSISCLGVKLDETLNWDEHIEMVCKKVGAGIGILKRIKPYVPLNTLISIYNALIQPYFDYCSPLWGVCNKTLRDNLQKFQNRAARIIAGASYEIRSADVLRTLDWENLETRWHLTKAKFLYKVLSNSAAPTLKDSFISRNTLLNNYNLRNSQTDLTLPKPNREFLKRSFKYSGAYLWNNLPLEAKQAQSIYLFKSCIKPNL